MIIALKNCFSPPFVIYYKGNKNLLYDKNILAVIGSREPTKYGIDATKKVLNELLDLENITIVSGLAKGIDAIAHQISLNHKQNTIAVLGCGLDVYYPKENFILYKDIEENGLLISEFPLGIGPDKKNFPQRNRIIAALAKSVLVCDALIVSGTQNTIRHALELDKNILAIPHPIFNESFCNKLIKEGATPILCGKDIIEEFF